jgi:ERCC4-related helicase
MAYKVLVSDSLAQEGLDILMSHTDMEVDYKPKVAPADLVQIIGD